MQDTGFSNEQKQYLEGYIAALLGRRGSAGTPEASIDPAAIHLAAQDRAVEAGGTLAPEELAKREKNPLDTWDEMLADADAGRFPRGLDVYRRKFHGLFYVAPNQDAFMLRLRLPGGILLAATARGLAAIAERLGGGYVDVTTRANLQMREIGATDAIEVLQAIDELGLTSRGAGADNIRNITGSPTAGIDRQELIDTRPLSRALHHYILNHRELYGLPRKFNIAFDGGGRVGVLEDTADIGFAAVRVGPGKAVPEGVWFRMLLGGLTGHGAIARDSGVVLAAEETVPAAAAILRLFTEHGDRTNRKKARLHYLIERWGIEKCLAAATFRWRFLPAGECEPRGGIDKHGHVGVHPQNQPGRFYIGVVLPVGRLGAERLRGLSEVAERFGSGTLRLTVWQNLLVSDIAEADLPEAETAIKALGLDTAAGARGAIVACTGNAGCRFALSDTKRHGLLLGEHLEARLKLDMPVNIHLTGCPNSCAQHYVGDIGLLAARVETAAGGEVEGYHLLVGGGSGAEARLGREIRRDIPATDLPLLIERLLRGYLAGRQPGESFHGFANRQGVAELATLLDGVGEG